MKIILIAADAGDAVAWQQEHGTRNVLVVTPRSPNGARGSRAIAVYVTDAVNEHSDFEQLVTVTMPALASTPRPFARVAPEGWEP